MIRNLIIAIVLSLSVATGAFALFPYFVPAAVALGAGVLTLLSGDTPAGSLDPKPLSQQEYDDKTNPQPTTTTTVQVLCKSRCEENRTGDYVGNVCEALMAESLAYWNNQGAEYSLKSWTENTDNSCKAQWWGDPEHSWEMTYWETYTTIIVNYLCPAGTTSSGSTCTIDIEGSDGLSDYLTGPDGIPFLDPSDPDSLPLDWQLNAGKFTHTETLQDGSTVITTIETTGTIGSYSITTTQSDVGVIHSDGTITTADIVDNIVLDENLDTVTTSRDYTAADGTPESITDVILNEQNQEPASNGISDLQSLLDIETNTGKTNELIGQSNNLLGDISGKLGDLIDSATMSADYDGTEYLGSGFDTGAAGLLDGAGDSTVFDVVDYNFLIPSSGSCQTLSFNWKGASTLFPNTDQCSKLGQMKEAFGWMLYIITALTIFGVATRRI